jgi:hypothetical protein
VGRRVAVPAAAAASVFKGRFPNSVLLNRLLPSGIVKLVVMLVLGVGIGSMVTHTVEQSADPALNAFVLLAVPGVVISLLELFGREGASKRDGWGELAVGRSHLGHRGVAGLVRLAVNGRDSCHSHFDTLDDLALSRTRPVVGTRSETRSLHWSTNRT